MNIETVAIDNIDIPRRLRAVDPSRVAALAESINEIGMQSPITLWAEPDAAFQLIAGAHRLEAAVSLGWEWIDAIFMDADQIDRQIWEIDENLMRSELTPTQKAEHLAKRKELWEARNSVASCNTTPGRPKRFDTETAEKTGVNRSTVNRAISRANGVSEEVRDEIRGTELDKGTVLDDLRRIAPEMQLDRVKEMRASRVNLNKIDDDVKARAAKEVASIMVEYVPEEWLAGLKSNLYSAGAKNIANELANIAGESR